MADAGTGDQAGIFVGRFTHSLDPKRRLTVPSEWRLQVEPQRGLYVLPDGQLQCLLVMPASRIAQRVEKIRRHSITDLKARQFARNLASQSDLVTWDTQGRIRVKDELLDFAGLTDLVAMAGAFDFFELWNPDRLAACGGLDRGNLSAAASSIEF